MMKIPRQQVSIKQAELLERACFGLAAANRFHAAFDLDRGVMNVKHVVEVFGCLTQ